MSHKLVTDRQGAHIAEMARQRGLTRDEFNQAQHTIGLVLAALKNGQPVRINNWTCTDEFTVELPPLPRPTINDLRESYPSSLRGDFEIVRDVSVRRGAKLELGTVLLRNEWINQQEEFERRVSTVTDLLGFQHLVWLRRHMVNSPDLLASLKERMGRNSISIVAPGLLVKIEKQLRYPTFSYMADWPNCPLGYVTGIGFKFFASDMGFGWDERIARART